MRAAAVDPGVAFWVAFAEHEGGLCEDGGDHSLVLLPESLQGQYSLTEAVVVTADPGVAREDGAILLAPGHPLLERAAELVLGRGDVGWAHLRWPGRPAPSADIMEARAREMVEVDHGRVDVVGQPIAVYLPVLSLGVLVAYSVSLDERLLEREEVMVDATTGLRLPDRTVGALRAGILLPGRARDHRTLDAHVPSALASAHGLLGPRLASRCQALGRQSVRARQEELERAAAYYQATLSSIASRRASANVERQVMLDAQAEITKMERDRRLGEIEESFRPTYVLRPYRLQLLGVPAVVVPVDVRRGPRRFPASLTWVPSAGAFAAQRCPTCASVQVLVAAKERLGCRGCLAGASPVLSSAGEG